MLSGINTKLHYSSIHREMAAELTYNICVAFQAQVTSADTGVTEGRGPVQISYAMLNDGTSQSSDNSAPKRVRLELNAGDKLGVQVAGLTPRSLEAYVKAPAGKSIMTLKRIY